MFHSLCNPFRGAAALLVLFSLTLGMAGCADVISYASDARRDGLKRMGEGNYVDAAGSFRNAVRQDPRDYKSFYYLGQCYDQMQSHHQAIQSYRSALDVMNVTLEGREDKPFRLKVIDGLAISLAKGGDRTFDSETVSDKSKPEEVKFITAKVYRNLGDADMALANYEQATQLDPREFAYIKEYGLYLEQLGQTAPATPVLKKAYGMNSRDPEVGAALERLGVVPGPSLKERDQLVKPPIPQGPLPEVDLSKVGALLPGGRQANEAETAGSDIDAADSFTEDDLQQQAPLDPAIPPASDPSPQD